MEEGAATSRHAGIGDSGDFICLWTAAGSDNGLPNIYSTWYRIGFYYRAAHDGAYQSYLRAEPLVGGNDSNIYLWLGRVRLDEASRLTTESLVRALIC